MLGLLAAGYRNAVRQPVVDGEVDIEPDWEVEIESLIAAAFRRECDAEFDGGALPLDVDRLALPEDFARGLGAAAEDAHDEFATSGADQPIESDDLAPSDGDRDILEALAGKMPGFKQHLAEGDRLLVVDLLDCAVDHQGHEFVLVGLLDVARANERPVAQHRYPVSELEHLFEAVADVDDGDAAIP